MGTIDLNDLRWRTSSFTGGDSGNCVEAAWPGGGAAIRDSKNRDGGTLLLTSTAWDAFRANLG
ncbi:uncharacterized protein DUF397 [Herbihabitans rhizosphaerae]|uniref:Uncharacterized protein DUF397 n=1 Tax=Herbihabitans rhizosphaerae TaxID=1872711 RepID=A0A4Q7KE84_9PSEU|nr:uncharacterized protein DUF397 [Herbihabitans rhizosphaerae]